MIEQFARWCSVGVLATIGGAGCGSSSKDDGVAGAANAAGMGAGAGGTTGGAAAGGAGNGSGGAAGGAGASSGGAAGANGGGGACDITISSSSISEAIATVGIVEWSTSVPDVTSARIEFGLDTSYAMAAPVDEVADSNRTLLLGMKQTKTYHYRVVVTSPAGDCATPDQTIETGALPTGLPNIGIDTRNAAALSGGFLITGQYAMGANGAPAYVLDADGEYVWVFKLTSDVTGVRPSYDAQFMWINSSNVPEASGANVHRVSMDGLIDEDLSDSFKGQNHQLTVLPDETVAFYSYAPSGDCDEIREYDPDTGRVKLLINSENAHGASGPCHVNAIEYSPATVNEPNGGYVFSDLENDNITKIKRDGEVVWVLGGMTNQFTGAGTTWTNQHGIDVLSADRILFFNNGGGNDSPTIIEMLLDLDKKTGERVWTYSDSTLRNPIMGDVQRLENGNTIVAYSTAGVVQELGPTGDVLQELTWPLGGAFGYIQKRKTLYGPPPR